MSVAYALSERFCENLAEGLQFCEKSSQSPSVECGEIPQNSEPYFFLPFLPLSSLNCISMC